MILGGMSISKRVCSQSPRRWLGRLLLALVATAATAGVAAGATVGRVVREGIAIELEIEPAGAPAETGLREGDTVTFRFRIHDVHTETPLSGVYPAAWMDLRPEGDDTGCQDKVEAFIGGSLFAPPELDLNVYNVLALNEDPTISVVDPLFGFGTTQLLDMIFLDARGEDWALALDQKTLYVSIPERNQVAVASTVTWEVLTELEVGSQPSRVALQSDGRYLWVGFDGPLDGLSGVSVVDTAVPAVEASILTGRGHHEIAFSTGDRFAFVTNQGSGTVSILDVAKLEKIKDVKVGREPVSLAYSPLAGAVYVASRGDGTITAIDAVRHDVVATAQSRPGLRQIKLAPGRRMAFVVNPETDTIDILDTATHRIVQTADVEDGPDQVAFSDHLAYVRHRGSEIVLMIPLDQVGDAGLPVPVIDFPGGQTPFGRGSNPSPADGIVQAPGATAVLIANPADRTIYFYKEGMAAPMGSFQNYGRQPRAVLAVDRSLREQAPGVYETAASLRRPGRYDVAFFLDAPRTVHCFEVEVAPGPDSAAAQAPSVAVEFASIGGVRSAEASGGISIPVGEELILRFRLVEPSTMRPRAGRDDVGVLSFRVPGADQRRRLARHVAEGVYEVDFTAPKPGVYYAFVECPSLGLRYDQSSQIIWVAKP